MARKLRVQYPGAIYHVMNRGDRREPIFRDDPDRTQFLHALGETCERTGAKATRKGGAAARLRRETTMTLHWVAERLRMGTADYLNHLPYWQRRENQK